MSVPNLEYPWRRQAADILNAGAARTVLLTGNVEDLFWLPSSLTGEPEGLGQYATIGDNLRAHWGKPESVVLVSYSLNGPIRFARESDREAVRTDWVKRETGMAPDDLAIQRMLAQGAAAKKFDAPGAEFDEYLMRVMGKPAVALTMLAELCRISRAANVGDALFGKRLVILIERADTIIPDGPITSLGEADRHRVMICQSWFSDPEFLHGRDSVVLIAESAASVNHRVVKLPQVSRVGVPSPDTQARSHYITWFNRCQPADRKIKLWGSQAELAELSAGLTIHALRQMLMGNVYDGEMLDPSHVLCRVEAYIESQLGEGVVRFKKPAHRLQDVVGATRLLTYLETKILPRIKAGGKKALSGFAVSGPIGSGKSFIFEAFASELGMVVLELRQVRSKWFGETDIMLERLYRVLVSLDRVMPFIDEADTVFGGVGADTHETERRLTGEIQKWMSDPSLRGKVVWCLMTARIQNLSPDIRRPGRAGDLIIPVLDPDGDDRDAFIRWTVKPVLDAMPEKGSEEWKKLETAMEGYSAADFGTLRSDLSAADEGDGLSIEDVIASVEERLPADIGDARRYQTLQALVNCTVKSLLPGSEKLTRADALALKVKWANDIREMELIGRTPRS